MISLLSREDRVCKAVEQDGVVGQVYVRSISSPLSVSWEISPGNIRRLRNGRTGCEENFKWTIIILADERNIALSRHVRCLCSGIGCATVPSRRWRRGNYRSDLSWPPSCVQIIEPTSRSLVYYSVDWTEITPGVCTTAWTIARGYVDFKRI